MNSNQARIIRDYGPGRPPRGPSPQLGLLLGLLVGMTISAIAYMVFYTWWTSAKPVPFWIAGAKLLTAIVLIVMSTRTRYAGIGLLLSIPLGALILFGSCFVHV